MTTHAGQREWYAEDTSTVLAELTSDAGAGLDPDEARRRLAESGPNKLPEPGRHGPFMRFLLQFHNTLIYVLIAAGAGKVLLGEWVDAMVIFGVVLINGLLGFVQEGRAEQAIASIRNMLSAAANALRDGKVREIPAEDLVPGDIVMLQSGDKVPADLRILEANSLRVEEAALTGESVPVEKFPDAVPRGAGVGDRKSMAYSGTLVVFGRAKGIVVETGANTELGHINRMLSGVKVMETPLLRQIERFGKVLTIAILILCVMAFAYGRLFLDEPFIDMFKAAVGIAVSAIPEGLPAVVTITLAIGVQRMARRNAIIRRLPAVETLGSVSRICSDKTGTLTLNEMVVTEAVTTSHRYDITGNGYAPDGRIHQGGKDAAPCRTLELMALASMLCNDSEIHEEGGAWKLTGDPTEGALLPFAAKAGLRRKDTLEKHPRTGEIPFESDHKFMATLHGETLFVKGAPDVLMDYCSAQQLDDGSRASLDRAFWERENDAIASRGQRVLALAWLPGAVLDPAKLSPTSLPRELVLLGLVGIIDPPRDEAIKAVAECREGGIRVTMITGDHAATAASIAAMLGIGEGAPPVTGAEIDGMDDEHLEAKCRRADVFARTSPEHKLRLVRAMQESGAVVAMTGDGVNDAPALKQADVGVAMGIKGTEVSKEAAAMVLADDNFASITAAVREGRTVFTNIEKAIIFMLPTNGGQALTILAAVLLGLTLPITPPQILWVNMVTTVTLGLALAFEPHESCVMRRKPRRVDRPLLDKLGTWRFAFISVLLLIFTFGTFFWMSHHGHDVAVSRTAALNALIIGQVFYLLSSRFLVDSSFTPRVFAGNKWVPISIVGVLVLQVFFTYTPFMNAIFDAAPLQSHVWRWLLLGGCVFFALVELEKTMIRLLLPQLAGTRGSPRA